MMRMQMIEKTVNAERIEQLIDVFGSFDENIKRIESEFGVRITNRGTELKVQGDIEAADQGARALEALLALAKTLADANDKYLRLAAEYDNYRKRTAREKEHLYNDAKIDTIKPFLAVLDNLERGVSQFEEGDAHRQGLELICKQFEEVLTKLNVAEIPALGEKFDPEKHNAVMHTEDETAAENTVVEVFQKGYTLGDKILRFAMVKVAN